MLKTSLAVASPRASWPRNITMGGKHLVELGNSVQQRVALCFDVDGRHALYRVLDAHLVVDHLRLNSQGDEVRLKARVRKDVFVLAVLDSGKNQEHARQKKKQNR